MIKNKYFDLDGVLADWVNEYSKTPELPPLEDFNKLDKVERNLLKSTLFSYDFFRNMKVIPEGLALLKEADADPNTTVRILSASGDHNVAEVSRAKREWVAEFIGDYEVILVRKVVDKWAAIDPSLADENTLIDDRPKACRAWIENGDSTAATVLFK